MGEPSNALAGFEALTDRNGFLRMRWRPVAEPDRSARSAEPEQT